MLDELSARWADALARVFPAGVPAHAQWKGKDAIVGTLRSLASPSTGHMFYAGHGGDDLVSVQPSARDAEWIELFSDQGMGWPLIVKPASLTFTCPHDCIEMAHFIFEHSAISDKPAFPQSSTDYYEEYAEAPNGKKFSHAQWDNDDDGQEGHLPKGTQRVLRYWNGGKIAIFSKASPYNQVNIPSFNAYAAAHMDPIEFPKIVEALTKFAISRRNRAA